MRRRRGLIAGTALLGTGLLRVALSSQPGSRRFYALTFAVAGTWIGGGLAAGSVPPTPTGTGHAPRSPQARARAVLAPVATGAAAFGAVYGVARVARRVPALNDAITDVLRYSHHGRGSLVLLTTLANGLGEEVFFRGAVYTALGGHRPVTLSTGVYVLATAATGNPALMLASTALGALFAGQRRATGTIEAPVLTHLTWSALMLRFVPRLFPPAQRG